MYRYLIFLFLVSFSCAESNTSNTLLTEEERWKQHAANTEIIRDDYGVPHIYGKSDADAVFGLLYAQCEDDFNRVERNYIWAIGRLAEIEGEELLYSDLRARLYMTKKEALENYESSPEWLKKLCIAFADGINYYLSCHPEVKPKLITHFEPWMPMYFSEGSIGGDIERVSTEKIQSFYGDTATRSFTASNDLFETPVKYDPQGSNGFAISGSMTESGNAMLLINPHTSFFFRGEVHVVSEEGLNAYGAVTWGQFFVYQGFNENNGWMHTSTGSDIIDEFAETIEKTKEGLVYKYGSESRKVDSNRVTLSYLTDDGEKTRSFMTYETHHGPITHEHEDKWIATALMWDPVKALEQSFTRMKKSSHQEFKKMMGIRTNSSNNTVYADSDGNIAYYHGNFIPRRDTSFDYTQPVDGSNPNTDWNGLHTVDENIFVFNPQNGWIQNCNSTPYTCASKYSPKQENYPVYMTSFPENFRGVHAIDLLSKTKNLNLDRLITLAYDPYIPMAEVLAKDIVKAYDMAPNPKVKPVIDLFRKWDYTTSKESVEMTLLRYYLRSYKELNTLDNTTRSFMEYIQNICDDVPDRDHMKYLKHAMNWIESDFGTWRTPWGELNRYQRNDGSIKQKFDDSAPSIPIGMASGHWGALASFGTRFYEGVKRQYGTYGNSFIAVVEFGDRVKAKTLLAGGQSGDPKSKHFGDQVQLYASYKFKTAAFYREDVIKRAKKRYHPGEE